ncbi:hypothetical protein AN964_09625 [Heyndrickxia shackletonii]|uniref:YpoC-like domain-containing protein n=1 Tax=Heyndrickxia shackletonii TaxID=157838 RepID=A0A0Q3TIG2_9BACI|nr:hypothetical protein [Heyndrickxia shackletonii]KQL53736.1 hypothetical protein AN964_09625 [Heyndrickxia shackletonii]MBB2481695.1 hypothetical protein [Bacillus sp. APMAM]NEY99878.1 hypothetical protein [Heyndrickxia shackletonii]RTZ54983.1 hypothetical protein EKO25_15290 [Bacillus sp. SAJ1]
MDITVPRELKHPLFFPDVNLKGIGREGEGIFFFPELLYYTEHSGLAPWLNSENEIPKLADKWKRIKDELVSLLKKRNIDIGLQMLKGIEIYFTLLFWSNEKPVQLFEWEKEVKLLDCKPINLVERLGFIVAKYHTYPAFIQLSELFTEQQKHYARKITIEKYKQK